MRPPTVRQSADREKALLGDGYLLRDPCVSVRTLCFPATFTSTPFYSEGSWIDRIENTWVFNPGRQIGQRPTSIVFDLEAMTAEWFSLDGACLKRLVIETGETSAPVASVVDA